MKAPVRQYSFTAGQLDDALQARADLEHYFKGAAELTNVVCQPTGGVTLRGGLVRDFEIDDAAAGCRLGSFEVDPQTGLLCVFTDKKIKIYENNLTKATIVTDYLGVDLRELDLNQKLDTMLITSKYYKPKRLFRQGSNENWQFSDAPFEKAPQSTFNDTTGGQNDIQQILFKSFQNGDTVRLSLEGYKSLSVVFDSSSTVTASNIKNALNGLEIIDSKDGGVVVTVVSATEYKIEFVGTDGKKDWQDIIVSIENTSSTAAQVIVKCLQEGKPPLEDLWSENRGYPYSSCHFQGRTYYGGSFAVPYQVNGSMNANPYSFRVTSETLDDEAVEFPCDSDGNCEVRRLFGLEKLFALSNKGVFVVKDAPITPSNAAASKQTDLPCAFVRPKEIDGSMVYITQTTDGINQTVSSITYNYENEKYRADDLAYLAPSMMREPLVMDVRRSIKRNHATYLFVINKRDGTLAVLNSKQSQGLNGWSLCKTEYGQFRDVCVVNGTAYFIIERLIGGQTHFFVEHWQDEARLDLGITLTSSAPKKVWNDNQLAIFNGMEVGVYVDDLPYGLAEVSNGQLTLDYEVSKIEVGLPFYWVAETMPAVVETETSTLVGHRYRVPFCSVKLQDTAGIYINGIQVCNRFFGRDAWDKDGIYISGLKTIRQLGWFGGERGREATVRCSGSSIQPATILSATMEVFF